MKKKHGYTFGSFNSCIAMIAQGAINIDCDITTIEKGSALHNAMHDLCAMVSDGLVALTPEGKKFEAAEKKRRDEMYA